VPRPAVGSLIQVFTWFRVLALSRAEPYALANYCECNHYLYSLKMSVQAQLSHLLGLIAYGYTPTEEKHEKSQPGRSVDGNLPIINHETYPSHILAQSVLTLDPCVVN